MANGIYLDLHFDPDWVGCSASGAWVIPVRISQSVGRPAYIAHDCCSTTELEHVLVQMEKDIVSIRKRAQLLFANDPAQQHA